MPLNRASYAFALVSVAAIVDVADGRIRSARVACGGVAHKPWRLETAEALLAGTAASTTRNSAAVTASADALLAGARGPGHNDFKIPLLRRTLAATRAEVMSS